MRKKLSNFLLIVFLGVFIIGRVPGIIAHINEENMDEDEFRRFCDLDDIIYEAGR